MKATQLYRKHNGEKLCNVIKRTRIKRWSNSFANKKMGC